MSHHRLSVLFAVLSTGASAQWVNFQTPGTPRTRDGKPDLAAPVPRAPDGKPDLSGVWMHEITTVAEVKRLFGNRFDEAIATGALGMEIGTQHKYEFDILLDFKPEESPLRPEAAEYMRQYAAGRRAGTDVCVGVPGIPRADLLSEPIKIIQAPRLTAILYEAGNSHRQIYTDGRALPKEFDLPAYFGYSVGHWEGDTLVVESNGFNGKAWLSGRGYPTSDGMRLTERMRRRDFGHMDIELTFDDPKAYTKPWKAELHPELIPDTELMEFVCNENERDLRHLTAK